MTSCVCCGGITKPTNVMNHSFSTVYVQCEVCRHIQLAKFPDDVAMSKFYESYSTNRNLSNSLIRQYKGRAKAQTEFIICYAPLREKGNNSICDIGCGYGFLLKELARYADKLVGIEVDVKCKEFISNSLKEYHIYLSRDLSDPLFSWDILDGFSLITMSHYLEHERYCNELIHNLFVHNCKYIFIEVPSEFNFIAGHLDDAHVHHFNSQSLNILLNKNGYDVLDVGYYGYSHVAPKNFFTCLFRNVERKFNNNNYWGKKNNQGVYLRVIGKLRQEV